MKILVVDDEPPTRECLRRLLAETDGDHEFAGEAANGWEAIDHCRAEPIDLVLMDTQMPGMTGLEAARRLALLERPPTIILMSPANTPAPLGCERQVAGRLLKPVGLDRLREALRLARTLSGFEKDRGRTTAIGPERRRTVDAWYRGGIQSVAVEDIIYLRADQKYVSIRHANGELLVDESLRSFEREFPDLFLRIHRNALVARARLGGLERQPDGSTQVQVRDCGDRLLVSRRHLSEVRRWLRETDRVARPVRDQPEPRRLPDQIQ